MYTQKKLKSFIINILVMKETKQCLISNKKSSNTKTTVKPLPMTTPSRQPLFIMGLVHSEWLVLYSQGNIPIFSLDQYIFLPKMTTSFPDQWPLALD